MPKFKSWLFNKLHIHSTKNNRKSSSPAPSTDPPVLPKIRKRALTPSPSHESLVLDTSPKCVFFQRLPWELRRQIQMDAFGGRTVHMDLQYTYPNLRGSSHAGLDNHYGRLWDRTGSLNWRWWSSVCHRHPIQGGWEDHCRSAGGVYCLLWAGEMPAKCLLGVMGWLLTCRQAYLEGLDVLYSTNTIHIGSAFLTRHLPLFILPQRLACITSLELAWELLLHSPFDPLAEHGKDEPAYNALVATVGSAFPSLTKLYISLDTLSCLSDAFDQKYESDEQKILHPMDEMVRKLGAQLQECQIAPPRSLYEALAAKAKRRGALIERERPGTFRWERFWRPVVEEHGEQSGDHLGYWVRQGIENTPIYESTLL